MVNLEEFKYGGTNLTAFRLLDPERAEVKQVVEDWLYGEMRRSGYGRKLDQGPSTSIKVILYFTNFSCSLPKSMRCTL